MEDWEGSSNPDRELFIRRSSRKRRPPGEWWKDFRDEKRELFALTSSEEAEAQEPMRETEDPSAFQDFAPTTSRENTSSSTSRENSLGEVYIRDDSDEAGCQADGKEPLYQGESTQEVTNLDSEVVPTSSFPAAGQNPLSDKPPEAVSGKGEKIRSDIAFVSQADGKEALYQGESTQELIDCHAEVIPNSSSPTAEDDLLNENCLELVSGKGKNMGSDSALVSQPHGNEPLHQGETTQQAINLDEEVVPTSSLPVAGVNLVSDKRPELVSGKGKKMRSDSAFASDVHEERTPALTIDDSEYTRSARRDGRTSSKAPTAISPQGGSQGTTVPAPSSHAGQNVGITDKSTRTTNRGSFRRFSGKTSGDDTPTAQRSVADEDMERQRSRNRFSQVPPRGSLDTLRVPLQHGAPSITRNVTPTGSGGGPKVGIGEPSHVRAPRKSRLKPTSPRHSSIFRPEPKPFAWSLINTSENQRNSMGENAAELPNSRLGVLVTKGTALKHNLVTGHAGAVKVAISISLNNSTVGEIVMLPRSTTGPRRALTGDEFYVVKRGRAECDIGRASVTLVAGDHLGIPNGQCFEMRNPSPSNLEFYFFSAKSDSPYSRAR